MGGIWLIGTPFGLYGTSGEPQGPPKGIFCPKRCPFGGPRSAVEVFEEAGAHDMDTAQPDGSASGSWAQIRPLGAAKGPPGPSKGRFWSKTDPFGGPRSSVEVSEGAQAHGMDAAHPAGPTSGSWAKNRPPGPSEDLRGPQKGILRPKQALFARF